MSPAKKKAPAKKRAPVTIGSPPIPTTNQGQGFYGATGYHSARVMRSIDQTNPTKAPGVRHENASRPRLVAESRAFVRDNLLYSGLIERCIDFSIGQGFSLIAEDKTVDALWEEWYQDCEITGRYKGGKLARAIAREYFTTGEGVVLKIGDGKIQLIETEQIPDNRGSNRTGIETDRTGKPIEFYVSDYVNGNLGAPRRVKARDVLFICERERPSSVRGIPPAQTAFPMLHRINDVCDAEALAMQMLSRIVLKHMTDTGGNFSDSGATNGNGITVADVPYGVVFEGSLDDELVPMERNIPGKDFPATITMFARLLGLPFGLPLELVLLDWTKSNYSQMKGALVLSDRRFQEIKELFTQDFYEPLFLWKRQQWIAQGLIADTPETLAHQWITPDFPWVDPLQEAKAQEKMVDLGLTSHGAACKRIGEERPKLLETLKRETIEAVTLAQQIEQKTGVLPPWQAFAGRSAGKTEQAVMAAQGSSQTAGENKEDEDDA